MGKTSYQSIDQIAKHISDQISKLNNGDLNVSDIDELTVNSQELYERLVVIRHKAFEKLGKPETAEPTIDTPIKETVKEVEEPIFNFADETKADEEQEEMAFDFSEPIVEDSIKNEAVADTVEVEDEAPSILNEKISQSTASLNDAFRDQKSESLADKLKQSKIKDLKSHIDINKKFSFISNLFKGSNENYNLAINQLNDCDNGDQARLILAELLTKNNWEVEDETVTNFVEIVERRFM